MISFQAFEPFIKQLRTDKGWRVELNVAENQFDYIKDLPKLQNKILNITIEIEEENNNSDFELIE